MTSWILESVLSLIYPPLCLHCSVSLKPGVQFLCIPCFQLLTLLEPDLHCKRCFHEKPSKRMHSKSNHSCKNCASKSLYTVSIAASFEYFGPAATLTKQLKYGDKPYLAKGLAGFMAAQFALLKWPLPDLIIPVPQSFSRFLTRGYNQAELLGEHLSSLLQCPMQLSLKKKSGSFSQAALKKEERMQMAEDLIYLKKNQDLADKTILLVDDVLTTGTTLQRAAESLMEGSPAKIYALTACYADH